MDLVGFGPLIENAQLAIQACKNPLHFLYPCPVLDFHLRKPTITRQTKQRPALPGLLPLCTRSTGHMIVD